MVNLTDSGSGPLLSEELLRSVAREYNVPTNKRPAWSELSAPQLWDILRTAGSPDSSGVQSSAAITTLCSIIQSQKDDSNFQKLLWHGNVWLACFQVYLAKLEFTRSKAVRSFLNMLVNLLQRQDTPLGIKSQVLNQVVQPIISRTARGKVKSALSALGHLISKQIVTVEELLPHFTGHPFSQHDGGEVYRDITSVFRELFRWAQFHELAPAVGQTASAFWKVARTEVAAIELPTAHNLLVESVCWINPLLEVLKQYHESLPRLKSHLFTSLFIIDVYEYSAFLERLGIQRLYSLEPKSPLDSRNAYSNNEYDYHLLLTSLQSGKELGIVHETDELNVNSVTVINGKVVLSTSTIKKLLLHPDGNVRLAGLSILAASPSTTRPMTSGGLKYLKRSLPLLFSETDAGLRGRILSLISSIFLRLTSVSNHFQNFILRSQSTLASKNVTGTITSKANIASSDIMTLKKAAVIVSHHQGFLGWIIRRCVRELRPESGYQRHIFALEVLSIAFASGIDVFGAPSIDKMSSKTVSKSLARLLADLVMSPYEDIRCLSATLLRSTIAVVESSPAVASHANFEPIHKAALRRAEDKMLQSGRADHADGYGRLYALSANVQVTTEKGQETLHSLESRVTKLLEKIRIGLIIARESSNDAISTEPLHGRLLALRYILDDAEIYKFTTPNKSLEPEIIIGPLLTKTVVALQDVWGVVHNVLCNDAPEGHVPDDLEEDSTLTYKDILSYSWRALKEVSGLIQVLAARAPMLSRADKLPALSRDDFEVITRLSFNALAELRHRGAFSAVAQAFAACCQRAAKESYDCLLEKLYEDALSCISARGSSITRRSAGIPSMIVGILSARPDGPLFARALADLQKEAVNQAVDPSEGGNLPQVHALNCLKSIFTNATLGNCSEKYIPMGLELSGKCLSSNIWAIRNCGLMLFRSLIDRLLGSTESQNLAESGKASVSKVSWPDYPALQQIVMQLLEEPEDTLALNSAIERVFPALKIIQRIPPPDHLRTNIRNRVLAFAASSHWHVRLMAARTFASLLSSSDDAMDVACEMLEDCSDTQNKLHGRLLCVFHSLKHLESSNPATILANRDAILEILDFSQFDDDIKTHEKQSEYNQALIFEILNLLLRSSLINEQVKNTSISVSGNGDFSENSTLVQRYHDYMLRVSHTPNIAPMLRKAAIIFQILNPSTRQFTISILSRAGDIDHDSCTWVLNELKELVHTMPANLLKMVAHVCTSIVFRTSGSPNTSAQGLLSAILDLPDSDFGDRPLDYWPQSRTLEDIFFGSNVLAPSMVESSLLLWSQLWSRAKSASPGTLKQGLMIIKILRSYMDESVPFAIRHSATKAMGNMCSLLQAGAFPKTRALDHVQQEYLLLLYDNLNDDDEELRDIAAGITAKATAVIESNSRSQPLIPLAASLNLISTMAKKYPTSRLLVTEAIQRMTSSKIMDRTLQPDARSRFNALETESTDLFAVERQNLYIDVVRESDMWSKLMRSIHPTASHLLPLYDWTIRGFEVANTTLQGKDGGWISFTSKPDVFVFLWQLLNSADTLLDLSRSRRVPEIPTQILVELTYSLSAVCDHPLLYEKAENIIQTHVLQRLTQSSSLLRDLLSPTPKAVAKRKLDESAVTKLETP